MSELRGIADAKIDAERKRLLAFVSDEIEAIKRKNAAAGMLRSGHTMVEITNICTRALDSVGGAVTTQYEWATSESLLSTQSYVDELICASRDQVAPLLAECITRLKREAELIAAPANAVNECVKKLEGKNYQVCDDIKLSLRSKFAEVKRSRVRGIWNAVTGWISKLIGVGPKP